MSLLTMQRSQEVEMWCRVSQLNAPLCSMDCLAMENSNAATRFISADCQDVFQEQARSVGYSKICIAQKGVR